MIKSKTIGLCRLVQVRRLTTGNELNLTPHLFNLKQGNGSGPFVEIPEIETLPRSNILFKLPRNTTIHGNINNISLIDVSKQASPGGKESLLTVTDTNNNLPRLDSSSQAVNLVADVAVPNSHVQFIKLEDYKEGFTINANAGASILYYNGEVTRTAIQVNNKLRLTNLLGHGVLGLKSNTGPIQRIALDNADVITIFNNSLLGMDRSCTIQQSPPSDNTNSNVLTKTINRYYDVISRYWQPATVDIKGPGMVLLQPMD